MSISKKEILKLAEIDAKLNEIYDMKNRYVAKLVERHGVCSGFTSVEGDKPFLRVKIEDMAAKLNAGETVYKSAGFSRYNVDIAYLKNQPK